MKFISLRLRDGKAKHRHDSTHDAEMRTAHSWSFLGAVALVLITGLLTGCGSGSSAFSGPSDSLPGQLEQRFATLYDTLAIPGAIIQIRFPDGSTWQSMRGIMEATSFPGGGDKTWQGLPLTDSNTHTRAGSITKTFTATLSLILATEGVIQLDGVIDDYLPDPGVVIPNSDRITLHQLLNMTSGLVNYSNTEAMVENWPPPLYTPQELIQMAVDDGGTLGNGTNFEPGEGWEYCNTNYIVLGLIAEARTGATYRELVMERIIEPLGLDETYVPAPTDEAIAPPNWHGYSIETTPGVWEDFFTANMSWAWSAGNIISTRDDLMTWVQALNQGTLLTEEMKTKQKAWVTTGLEGLLYGYGIGQMSVYDGGELIGYLEGHNGGAPGYETSGYKFNDYYLVVMCNGRHIPARECLGHNGDFICYEMAKLLHRSEQ